MGLELKETKYTRAAREERGLAVWNQMLREVADNRELIWRLFLRDVSARYRQTILGYVWALMPPIVATVTFSWLSSNQVIQTEGTILPYPLYVLVATTVWQFFAGGLLNTTQSLANAGALVAKVGFPRKTLVIASFGQTLVDTLIRIILLIVAFAAYGFKPSWTALFIPFLVIPLGFLSLGLGFVFALVNGVTRDAAQFIGFLATFWMFLTPVVYPAHATSRGWLRFNPVTPFVVETHGLLVGTRFSDPGAYLIASAVALCILLAGWRFFDLAEPRIAERV